MGDQLMSTLRDVEVGLKVDDPAAVIARDSWGEPRLATRVAWRATLADVGSVIVCVTAFAATHQNRSWFDPRFFVADGLRSEPPPEWVPDAPAWFWAAVEEMAQ